jgi:hypothetical protein
MNRNPKIAFAGTLMLGLVLAGCAQAPQEEIASSRESLDAARSATAETWASAEWDQAEKAMTTVDQELAVQAAKMAPFRSYKRTSELLAEAKGQAEAARSAAVANKEEARQGASAAIEAVQAALVSTNALTTHMASCPAKSKGFDADLSVVTGNLQALQGQLGAVQGFYDSEDYSAASQEADALRAEVETLSTDLQGVMEKIGCKPPATATPVA